MITVAQSRLPRDAEEDQMPLGLIFDPISAYMQLVTTPAIKESSLTDGH